jgi:hypothetical protein
MITFKNQTGTLRLVPTLAFAPKTELIFFTVASYYYVPSYELTLDLKHEVGLNLAEDEVKPGKAVTLNVSALKYSTVALFAGMKVDFVV